MANSIRAACTILTFAALAVSCSAQRQGEPEENQSVAEQTQEELVSTHFTVGQSELAALIAPLPEPVESAILGDPARFFSLVYTVLSVPEELTVLADKNNPLGADYRPETIIALDEYRNELSLSREGHRLAEITVEPLRAMTAAANADGIVLLISSAYRSYTYQQQVYARWVDQLGQVEADRVSARPGTSQHQLGTAVDFGCICPEFANEPAGEWLANNAHRFGFSLSYPDGAESITGYSYEPWHFRYIGVAASELEQQFFAGMQQWMLEWLDTHRDLLEAARTD